MGTVCDWTVDTCTSLIELHRTWVPDVCLVRESSHLQPSHTRETGAVRGAAISFRGSGRCRIKCEARGSNGQLGLGTR